MKKIKNFWLILGIVDVVAILVLSLISKTTIRLISFTDLASLDKMGHLLFYGFASLSFAAHFKINKIKMSYPYSRICIILFVMGFLLEFLQFYSGLGRHFDYLDQVANTIGITMGVLFCHHVLLPRNNTNQSLND